MKTFIPLIFSVVLISCGGTTSHDLEAVVNVENGQVVIESYTDQSFRRGNVIINDAYMKNTVIPKAGTLKLNLMEFTKQDGTRFSALKKVKQIEIIMLNDKGTWKYKASWN